MKHLEPIILYTIGCPRCKMLEQMLLSSGLTFDIVKDKEVMLRLGFTDVPMLVVGEDTLDYNEAKTWLNTMRKDNVNEVQ